MTERLYYTDAYLAEFEARVAARADEGRRVALDRSAFYPTSGGQPHDTGTLAGVRVVDVVDEDDVVWHLLERPLPAGQETVRGIVDRERRRDHMQQHTGQHLLSALFADRLGLHTASVHFGAEYSTVDLAGPAPDAAALAEVERVANEVVAENRPVAVTFEEAASATGLRKPTERSGTIRVVSIEGIDRSACGGTHVRRTGEIGAVLLRRPEKVKQGTRVEFLCGGRAVRRARADFELLVRLSQGFSTAIDDLPPLLERQRDAAKEGEKERRRLEGALDAYRARALYDATGSASNGVRVVVQRDAEDMERLRSIAQAVCALPRAVFVGSVASPPSLLVASSGDVALDAGALVRRVVTARGGRGGGTPRLAQGSVPDAASLESAYREATEAVAGAV